MPENKLESSHNKKASKPFMSHIDRNTMTMTENCFDLTGHTIPYTNKAVQPGTLSHRHDGAIPPTP